MDVVYIEVNNWFPGMDYPELPIIYHGMYEEAWFSNEKWVEEQKLCIKAGPIDMSMNYCITAPRSWVEDNCPELLTSDDCYTYDIVVRSNGSEHTQTRTKKYSDFVREPDEYGVAEGQFGWTFLEYNEDNIGITWCDDHDDSWLDEDEEDEDGNC